MVSQISNDKWKLFGVIALVSLAIPFVIVGYVLVTTDKDSVVFLEDTNPLLSLLIILYYVLIISIGIVWLIRQVIQIFKLKNETVKNELRHLQSQVNPHFFFNVLNNLYGMVDKDKETAKELIIKLSDLMRYSIYDGQKDTVSIGEEVAYLRNYIELHQMRYHKKSDIQFEVELEDEGLEVMPLMFIVLVENAFKHGMEHLRKNAFVHIKLAAKKDSLSFQVTNNYDAEEVPSESGMGLKNLRRRLTLKYPKKHDLSITKTPDLHTVTLNLHQL